MAIFLETVIFLLLFTTITDPKKLLFSKVMYELQEAQKNSVRHQHPTCVFISFLEVISIQQNKSQTHTTSQSKVTIPNVSRWPFFHFHAHSGTISSSLKICENMRFLKVSSNFNRSKKILKGLNMTIQVCRSISRFQRLLRTKNHVNRTRRSKDMHISIFLKP